MIINGPLTLGSTVRMSQTAAGLPQLLLHALDDGIGPNGVAYKLVWSGQRAKAFFEAREHQLKIGAALNVTAINPQALCMDGGLYVLAGVLDIQVIPSQAQTPPTAAAARAPQTQWRPTHEAATV